MRTTVLALAFSLAVASSSFAQQCLHGDDETSAQAARRREALVAARVVNTLQANQPGAAQNRYLRHDELGRAASGVPPGISLAPDTDIAAGWRLSLDVALAGYWFSIRDTTDPCGFSYISNAAGLIYSAEPIR
ncbi:MAG: hypothetical protein HOP14_06485 [Acidobacteria bacterium]|nr:hypothetical protein [Acidobacteriota bacterium]